MWQAERTKGIRDERKAAAKKFLETFSDPWIGVAMKKLKVGDLSTLLAANHMMKSGSRVELVERLPRCRSHGSPGPCPECRHPKLFFEYGSDALCHAHTCTAPTNTADTGNAR